MLEFKIAKIILEYICADNYWLNNHAKNIKTPLNREGFCNACPSNILSNLAERHDSK